MSQPKTDKLLSFFQLSLFFGIVSCNSSCDSPKLPDINTKSFSYEEQVSKKDALAKRRSEVANTVEKKAN